MKLFEKLRQKLNKELNFDIPKHATFKRTYAGYWQLSAGAWKWVCSWPEYPYDIGSAYTALEILKSKKLSRYNFTEIMIDD